ncbi:MAG: hypothetical protein AAFX53_16640 [Bacteroidota bacterium]
MADKQPANQQNSPDEIDLGQLFQMIGRGFQRLFEAFLRVFLYLKKNALVLIVLAVLGSAIGIGLNQIVTKKMKTEVIVKPNLESKNYLYDVISEIQANIRAKDSSLIALLGTTEENLKSFKVSIEPVEERRSERELGDQLKYLQTLQNFQGTEIVRDVIKTEILNNSTLNHRITFFYKDTENGHKFAKSLMSYINSNPYFAELIEVYRENAKERMAMNDKLLGQLDNLIANYSKNIAKEDNLLNEGKIVLDNGEETDIKGLFELKNDLIRDSERKRLELKERKEAISIINFGRPQQVQKVFFGKNIVLIPTILIGLFFLWSIIRYLNGKASEIAK